MAQSIESHIFVSIAVSSFACDFDDDQCGYMNASSGIGNLEPWVPMLTSSFLSTDHSSGKNNWKRTCIIQVFV